MASKEKYHECWICDGRWVYQFDHVQKKLVQSELPPEIRGQAIGKGPLPFLFNAKADDIKRRFWLRIITPQGAKNEYWLEAVPRHQEDAGNFDMIHVIIDGTDYLPKAMIQFDPGFDAVERPARKAYQFNDREVNFSILKEQLNIFHREFYEPSVPKGWTKEVQKHVQSAGPRQSAPAGNRAARGVPATRR